MTAQPNRLQVPDHATPVVLVGLLAGACALAGILLWPYLGNRIGTAPAASALALGAGLLVGLASRSLCRNLLQRRSASVAAEKERESAVTRHEARLQAERMRAIVATATEGIITIDHNGIILTFNRAAEKMFGWTAAEVAGQRVELLMPPPFRDEHAGYLGRYLETGEARIIGIGREVVGMRRDGSTFPIELSIGEGFVEQERFFTALVRDITERKELQAKLSQTERLAAVGELAAGVAHEINNPINTIMNCAQLILDGDDGRANATVIVEESNRIATIVKDLLRFARDDRDSPQPTSIGEVVERTLRLIGENFKRHGIALSVDVPNDVPQVLSRPQQLQQVLLNLILNAKDALLHQEPRRDDRAIALRAGPDGDGVAILVEDNGPGIPEQLGERIFEPFVTTKRARGGTGLGLSISRSIVEDYGGQLTVSSSPGRGAAFRIWLPCSRESRD